MSKGWKVGILGEAWRDRDRAKVLVKEPNAKVLLRLYLGRPAYYALSNAEREAAAQSLLEDWRRRHGRATQTNGSPPSVNGRGSK